MTTNAPCQAFDLLLAEMRGLALKTSSVWFLWVNILFALFILGRTYFSPDSLPVASHLPSVVMESVMAIVLFISSAGLFIMRLAPIQNAPWLGKLAHMAVLTQSLCWSACFYVLIASDDLKIVFPFAAVLLFSALISLYFNPYVLLSFIAPIWLTIFITSMAYNANITVLYSLLWVLLAGLIESGRRMLNNWFMLALKTQQKNVDLISQLELLANRDPLTGIANRRAFELRMDEEVTRHQREGGVFSLIMLDVDHFKRYNDDFGHQTGDRCLATLAQCLARASLQATGIPGRIGGEEFVVLLPQCNEAQAIDVAEAIAEDLRQLNIEHPGSLVIPRVTVSQGIASWRPGMSPRTLVAHADTALYQAKQQGRNRFVMYQHPEKSAAGVNTGAA
ncbi:GGDEF domain-containing protein [Trabulsiella odontotermitis]|uniref:GGDEF domain-containing protein n=1 Tax=Trabulsiella odontotermitis TaxID=379893 RepID=UPI0006769158|nr:membrane-associated sensor domain-containing protein [Trabulsiella odontotermitis]